MKTFMPIEKRNTKMKKLHQAEPLPSNFLERITIIITKNLHDEKFGVDQLQKELLISYPHMYRKIKGLTGCTPSLYIRQLRLERAAYFLQQSDMQIRQIAFKVGFNTPNYFTSCFLEYFGCTPSTYRKNNS